jgi:hypothetical protein
MLAAVDYCRNRASGCIRLGTASKNDAAKQFFEDCAHIWSQLATDRERWLTEKLNSDLHNRPNAPM